MHTIVYVAACALQLGPKYVAVLLKILGNVQREDFVRLAVTKLDDLLAEDTHVRAHFAVGEDGMVRAGALARLVSFSQDSYVVEIAAAALGKIFR